MMLRLRHVLFAVLLGTFTLSGAQAVYAACADPVGVAGEVVYNTTYGTMAFCDNTNWISMAGGVAAGGGGGLTNGDKGDITVGGSGALLTVDDGAISYIKLQDTSAGSVLLGRGAGAAGTVQEITIGTGLTMTGTVLSAGTVTADSLNFTEFSDTLLLDAPTDISVTGTDVLSITNSGTGDSFVVNDGTTDTTPFVIDATGHVVVGATTAEASALMTLASTSQGFLPPRMTTAQRDAISSPATGLVVYDTDLNSLYIKTASAWAAVGAGGSGVQPAFLVNRNGTNQTITASTPTKIQFTHEAYDTSNNFDNATNYQFTPNVPGKYIFILSTYFVTGAASDYIAPMIYKNGSVAAQNNIVSTAASQGLAQSVQVILDMNGSTDYVEGYVQSNRVTLNGTAVQTYFAGALIGGGGGGGGGSSQWADVTGGLSYASGGAAVGTATLNASAILQADSTTKGFLPPRMTTAERDAIASPAEGLMVYNTDTKSFEVRTATSWLSFSGSQSGATMVSGWPDTIICDPYVLIYWRRGSATDNRYVDVADGSARYVSFNDNGTYNTALNGGVCVSKSIAQLYSEGRAFNLVGGGSGTSSLVGFVATSTQNYTTTSTTIGSYTEARDDGNNLNATTGVFTAPANGYYFFSARAYHSSSGGGDPDLVLTANSVQICRLYEGSVPAGNFYRSCSGGAYLAAGQTAFINVKNGSGTTSGETYFSGFAVGGGGGGGSVTDDSLDFDKFIDAMNLDASTDIALDGTENLTFSNTGTGTSLRVNDVASDTTSFIIDDAGNVAIGANATVTANKAILQLDSTTQGFLPPRMTTAQRDAISSPATGLTVYNTTTSSLNVYNGTGWQTASGTGSSCTFTTTTFSYTGSNQSFVVPAGCDYIQVKAWGAGGGGGYNSQNGGPGGFTTAVIPVTPGETLTLVVGARGNRNTSGTIGLETANYGYGGTVYSGGQTCAVGHGGGLAGLFRGAPSQGTALVIAGGGGGASGYTQGSGGNDPTYSGGVPASMTGANHASTQWTPGGGGGYQGGTLHTRSTTNSTYPSGNGGRGFVTTGAIASTMSYTAEFSVSAPGTTDPDYPGSNVGKGGLGAANYTTNCTDAGHAAIVLKPSTTLGGGGGGGSTTLAALTDVDVTTPPTNGQALTYNNGTSKWVPTTLADGSGPQVAFSAHKNGTNQTVTSNTTTKLTWSTEAFDTNNNFVTGTGATDSRFTPTVAGKYLINLAASCNGGTACYLYLYKNGVRINAAGEASANGNAVLSMIVDINGSGDYLEGYIHHAGGTVVGGTDYTYFNGILMNSGGGGSVTDDSLDFDKFIDAMNLDASTDIALDGTENLTFSNTGTGTSLRVNDVASDTTSFIIDDAGNVAIGANATVTANKAILQLDSTTQGFLPPRMTTAQRNAISSPATGLVVYNTDTNALEFYNGTAWSYASQSGSIDYIDAADLTGAGYSSAVNGSLTINNNDACSYTTTSFAGDFTANITLPSFGGGVFFMGAFAASEVGTFNSANQWGGMTSMTNSYAMGSHSSFTTYKGASNVSSTYMQQNTNYQLVRTSGVMSMRANGVTVYTWAAAYNSAMKVALCHSNNNNGLVISSAYTVNGTTFGGGGGSTTLAGLTDVSVSGVTAGQSLIYNGTQWAATTATSYTLIPGATGTNIGTLTSGGGLAAIFDGNTSQDNTTGAITPSAVASGYAGKNYSASPKTVGRVTTYPSTASFYVGSSAATLTINLRAKNGSAPSSASDGTLLGTTGSFTDANVSKTIYSNDIGTAWDYVWVEIIPVSSENALLAELQVYSSSAGGGGSVTADSLDFTDFKDAMALDASTDISVTGAMVLSVTNTGTGNSLLVNDEASDATPFVIDAAGNVAIGAATVTAGMALDVVGTTTTNQIVLKSVTGAAAPGSGSGSLRQMMIVQDQKPNGTDAGASIAGVQTRVLNTVQTNTIAGASLAANVVTLPAGTYKIEASVPGYSVNRHQARLYNATASSVLLAGTGEYADSSNSVYNSSKIEGVIVLSGTTQIRIEHNTTTATSTNGLGVGGPTWAGTNNVYTTMTIEKLQ